MYRCSVCGYIHDGDHSPHVCPKCGVASDMFHEIDEPTKALILRSRKTNELHLNVMAQLTSIMELVRQGIDDDLDANCVKIFSRVHSNAHESIQSIKAELQAHMNRSKWG